MKTKSKLMICFLAALLSLSSCGQPANSSSAPTVLSVEDEPITLTIDFWDEASGDLVTVTRDGLYTGEMMDGLPNGQGTFSALNEAGATWTYTGGFQNGKFDGYGKTVWPEIGQSEEGTYVDGIFTPNTYELFQALAPRSFISYSFSKENELFVKDNLELFPANTEDAIQSASALVNPELTYPMMTKTLEGLEGQLYQCNSAQVLQIFQSSWYGHTVTDIIAKDKDLNTYVIFFDGELPDVYDDTKIDFIGLPISYSSYENVGGGATLAVVLLGSSVNLLE